MRLALSPVGIQCSQGRLQAEWGEGQEVGFPRQTDLAIRCFHVATQSERVPHIRFSWKFRRRSNCNFQLSFFIFPIKRSQWWRTCLGANLAHACPPYAPTSHPPPPFSILFCPPSIPCSSLHHLALSRSARLLTTCAFAGAAFALGLIVHW